MGIDGIKKQHEINQHQVADHRQEKQEVLNQLYHVDRPQQRLSMNWRLFWYALGVIAVLVVGYGLIVRSNHQSVVSSSNINRNSRVSTPEAVDPEAWYAVHLIDGKVYYGNMLTVNPATPLTLVNVFYVASADKETVKATTTIPANKLVLVKLGTEAHRPEDKIVIGSEALVFFEKLSFDSPVVKAIEGYLGEGSR